MAGGHTGAKVGFRNMEKPYGRDPAEKGRLKMPNREAITDISRLPRKHRRVRSRTQAEFDLSQEEEPFLHYNCQSREGRDVIR